ncbi:MAG: DUF503 domain-containing protein [Desulfuromonas sp.]|nr:MAG: DUF503 domain-containing protein [Desulfuromonas sp.]
MVVGVLDIELHLYAPQSLKEKRGIVRSLVGRIRSRHPVSCAETGHQDFWQKARIGITMVGISENSISPVLERIERDIQSSGEVEITRRELEFLHYGEL